MGKSAEEILKTKGIYPGFRSTYTYEGIVEAMHEFATQPLPVDGYREAGLDQPWPLIDVLKTLSEAGNILLNKKDYDGPIHEEIQHSIRRANEIVAALSSHPSPNQEQGEK